VSAEARRNGWRGFDGIGERFEPNGFGHGPQRGGYIYRCDGMPSLWGCSEQLIVTRKLSRVGTKSSGWYVCYGRDDPGEPGDDGKGNDLDVVLTFCPECTKVVKEQEKSYVQ